ncbi:MAG: metallophosphoesterase [Bacteroidales bacterium]|nr:metallophosphoesterase [Bacteroidales bacterium]MDD4670182.1 metallophosphoesterase [Bacteroidales bacterium]
MKIAATADIHGHLPEVPACDVFTISGDIFPKEMDKASCFQQVWFEKSFLPWIDTLLCDNIVMIGGNHDYYFQENNEMLLKMYNGERTTQYGKRLIYLCDTGICIDGVSFYGTPWVPKPTRNLAFFLEHDDLLEKFRQIPDHIDVLLTHASPCIERMGYVNDLDRDIGSVELLEALEERHIGFVLCGHIHSGNHDKVRWNGSTCYNLSYCDNHKNPAYPLVEINL